MQLDIQRVAGEASDTFDTIERCIHAALDAGPRQSTRAGNCAANFPALRVPPTSASLPLRVPWFLQRGRCVGTLAWCNSLCSICLRYPLWQRHSLIQIKHGCEAFRAGLEFLSANRTRIP